MNHTKYEWTDGSGRLVLNLTQRQVERGYHRGACDDDIASLRKDSDLAAQLDALNPEHVSMFLSEYGAWDDEEENSHNADLSRVLWLACGDCFDAPERYTTENYADDLEHCDKCGATLEESQIGLCGDCQE